MFGVTGSGDTSGYGRLVRTIPTPGSSNRPFGGDFDYVADELERAFPAFNDGRGFSIAKRLRHLGFTRTLRATGPLIADQYAYAKACGFDEIDLPETLAQRQTADQWLKAANAISLSYQRGYHRPVTILDQRRAKAS